MKKAFIFRHQHGGHDTSFVFLNKPTDEQMKVLAERADAVHGSGWAIASEVDLVVDNSVPDVNAPDQGSDEDSSGQVKLDFVCSGVGNVS